MSSSSTTAASTIFGGSRNGASSSKDDEEAEKKRMNVVSIEQQFAWTGLDKSNQTRHRYQHKSIVKKRKTSTASDDKDDDNAVVDKTKKHDDGLEPNDTHPGRSGSTAYTMEGLILWHVLGYALRDPTDYLHLCLVNKEFNTIVKKLEPHAIFQIKNVLQLQQEKKLVITKEEHLPLLNSILHSIKSRDSALYRKDRTPALTRSSNETFPKKEEEVDEYRSEDWPKLQPHFCMLLMRFVYEGATQRNSSNEEEDDDEGTEVAVQQQNLSSSIYELVCNYLQTIADQTARDIWRTINKMMIVEDSKDEKQSVISVRDLFRELLATWNQWNGILKTVVIIAGYLDRFHVKLSLLDSVTTHGQTCLLSSLLVEYKEQSSSQSNFVQLVLDAIHKIVGAAAQETTTIDSKIPIQWLLQAWKAYQTILTYPRRRTTEGNEDNEPLALTEQQRQVYDQIQYRMEQLNGKEEEAKKKKCNADDDDCNNLNKKRKATTTTTTRSHDSKKGEMITIQFPHNKQQVSISKHFVMSSEFFRNVQLQHGDIIKWDNCNDKHCFELALRFYNLDEVRRMPAITTPVVRTTNIVELVGTEYAEFVDSLSMQEVFEVVRFANFLHLKSLMDLTCLAISRRIQNLPPTELQRLFLDTP